MYFPNEQQEFKRQSQWRTVYVFENNNKDQKPIQIKLAKKNNTFREIMKTLKISNLRLFNSEGAEYFQDDLEFIKNKAILYASRGQDFDATSCFMEYQMLKELGQGGFGKVYLAQHKFTKEKYAIKIIKTQKIGSAADIDSIFIEAEILKSLRHDNIVKVHNCLTLKNMQVAIIMQFLEGGELLKLVQKQKRLSEETACNFFRQIIKGIFYCHQNNLIHRDLKLENMLLVSSQEKKIKIIDFGIAGLINYFTWQDLDTGSLAYMAPQCFINNKSYKIDGRIDIWAMGVILYGMLVGQLPFKGHNNRQKIECIKLGYYRIPFDVLKTLSRQCIDVVKRCLDPNPKTRISIEQLSDHPWVVDKMFLERVQQDYYQDIIIEKADKEIKQITALNVIVTNKGAKSQKQEKQVIQPSLKRAKQKQKQKQNKSLSISHSKTGLGKVNGSGLYKKPATSYGTRNGTNVSTAQRSLNTSCSNFRKTHK